MQRERGTRDSGYILGHLVPLVPIRNKQMQDYNESEYIAKIRISEDDLDWIKENKGKKSAAGFLKEIIKEFKLTKDK